MKKKRQRIREKGITLIALVITIIILLILAGVTIATLTGDNGILKQANNAKERTKQASVEENIELILQEAYMDEYLNGADRMEHLKQELLKLGAEKVWDMESYEKEYWKYNDIIIIINPNKYSINNVANTLVNNEGNSNEKGFLVDVSQGGICRKDIETITFSNQIPENYTISYDVSERKDGSIILYGVTNESGKYDVFIASRNNETIYTPAYSARLFGDLTGLKSINLGNLNTTNTTNMQSMFIGCNVLEELDLNNFNTTNVEDMTNMFYNCNNLKHIKLDNFNTKNVTNMQSMFGKCQNLTEINLDSFNTSKVTNMASMFFQCNNLTTLNLDNFDTSKVTTMYYMFSNCNKLSQIELNNFNTENVINMQNMFANCTSLTELSLETFNTTKVELMGGMFSYSNNLLMIYVGKGWNVENADTKGMFYNCGTNKVTIR